MISDEKTLEVIETVGSLMRCAKMKREMGFSHGEVFVLTYLEHNGKATAGELGKVSGVGSGRIANILKSLEQKGEIKREEHPEDKRKVVVVLTEKGTDKIIKEKKEVFSRAKNTLKCLSEDEADNFIYILKKIRAGVYGEVVNTADNITDN